MNESMRAAVLWAMRDEAFASAEYALFAEQARSEGRDDLAALFAGAANVELHEHFAGLAAAYGLCGSSDENLEKAIRDESASGRHGFALLGKWAREAGEQAFADRCEEYERDEYSQVHRFERALHALEAPS